MTPAALEPGTLDVPPAAAGLESRSILKTYFETGDVPTGGLYEFSGEFHLAAVDLRIPGRGLDFVWSRKYRSKAGPSTSMGNGWDSSYNVRLEQDGADLVLHDGNARADLYVHVSGAAGSQWYAREFFREIIQEPDTSYVCRFAHRGEWRFHPFDGSPQAGRLSAIVDTNGNALGFAYDPAGRLTTITDTLDRAITLAYSPDGHIESVTDFAGRQVRYEYYTESDVGGSAGDLKTVTSPAVTGTPNGNDFPAGKTVTFTYSTGFADEALNHNLLTITDAKGQTFLANVYAATSDPAAPDFDRVMRRVLGDPGGIIDYVYEDETPGLDNGYAVTRAIINDRNGHVAEHLCDMFNRCVVIREYAGQALPDEPTTSETNRPTGKLRPGDPDFFETRFEYNDDSLLTRVIGPELDAEEFVYEGDLDFFAPRDKRGNLRNRIATPGPSGGDQTAIIEEYEYDDGLSAGTNQVTRSVDGRGNETLHEYDASGNRTRTTHRIPSIAEDFEYNTFGQLTAHVHPDNGSGHRRRDAFTYYAAGPQRGYLRDAIADEPGLALTTTYEYDLVGNVTRVIDARGNDELYDVNELDQTVRITSRQSDPVNPVRYVRDIFYDENDNVVRIDVENRDETGTLQPNTHLTTIHEYDSLDRVTTTTREVHNNDSVVVEYEYDAAGNRTLVRSGEATNGDQPTNAVRTLYDERDLVFRVVRAEGDQDQSTTQYDYDVNANVVRITQGLEAGEVGGTPRVSVSIYDGYDRLVATQDPMGNEQTFHYDANSNPVSVRVDGELIDVPGGDGNVKLSERALTYDAMDRLTTENREFYEYPDIDIDDGSDTTTYIYSDDSRILSAIDDNGHATTLTYDSVDRVSTVTDAKDNTATRVYDGNSNVVTVTETDKSDLGLPDEVFVTTYTYDGLDRRTTSTDSSGNTHTFRYDSRDNHVVTIDALLRETRHNYDGLDRRTETIIDLDNDGADGDGLDIVTTQVWDDNSRVVQRIDDNGNTTFDGYDSLDRPVLRHLADGTSETYTYDAHDNVVNRGDANGSSFTSTYDLLDRVTNKTIAVCPGVSPDTTFEMSVYDGLGRVVATQDDDSLVEFTWDSRSNLRQEALGGQATTSTHDGVGNRLSCTYPSGRTLSFTYDELDRLATVEQGPATVAGYHYVGSDRIAWRQAANGTTTMYTYDGVTGVPNPPGDFGVRRIVGIAHEDGGGSEIDTRTYRWDRLCNKTQRVDVRTGGPELTHTYQYDSADRLMRTVVEDNFGIARRDSIYDLDGVGNRLSINGFGGITGPYLLDPNMPPADWQVNQYTQTPLGQQQYDENGNLATVATAIGMTDHHYDCYDRLVVRVDTLTGDTAEYAYDSLGRRTVKRITPGGGGLPEETRYFYDGAHVIEEQDPGSVMLVSYIRGARGGDIVCVESGGHVYYHHTDDLGNVVALTNQNGAVVERYEYGDFGSPEFFDGAGAPLPESAVGNPYLSGGHRRDRETGLYVFGGRYLDPENGRYITRDPAGMWNNAGNGGNAYTYAGGNPWSAGRSCGGALKNGNRVALAGLGLFSISNRAARTGRNPQTGKEIQIAAKSVAKFKAGKALADTVKAHGGGGNCEGGHRGEHEQMCYKCGLYRCVCRGGKTVIKGMAGGGNHCPGCGAMLCRCKDTATRSPQGGYWCKKCKAHHGHETILKSMGGAGGHFGEFEREVEILSSIAVRPPRIGIVMEHHRTAGGGSAIFGGPGPGKACGCASCGNCSHGVPMRTCKEDHLPILPAANNIPSR